MRSKLTPRSAVALWLRHRNQMDSDLNKKNRYHTRQRSQTDFNMTSEYTENQQIPQEGIRVDNGVHYRVGETFFFLGHGSKSIVPSSRDFFASAVSKPEAHLLDPDELYQLAKTISDKSPITANQPVQPAPTAPPLPKPPITQESMLNALHEAEQRPPRPKPEPEQKTEQQNAPFTVGVQPFDKEVFENLPDQLKTPCAALVSDTEREVFLVGALGVASGLLPNVKGFYDGKMIYANLYSYVLAPYGAGKGALSFSYELGKEVHRAMRELAKQETSEYEASLLVYENEVKAFKSKKGLGVEPPQKPQEPKNRMHYIPANNSKTGFLQLVEENDQSGTLFATEADTVADTIAQDYGNYSDALRAGFHHEPIPYFRRGNGGEYVEMENPRISVVLSSSEDQLVRLMPSVANGLFSRFLYYNAPPDPTFRNVFDRRKRDYEKVFSDAATEFKKIYNLLHARTVPVEVQLTEAQEAVFLAHFSTTKSSIYNEHDQALGGTVNRLGTICFRICMILTVLRSLENGEALTDVLTCSETDFDNAMRMIRTFTAHALVVADKLPKPKRFSNDSREHQKYESIKADKAASVLWSDIAEKWGFKSKQAVQQWYERAQKRIEKQNRQRVDDVDEC